MIRRVIFTACASLSLKATFSSCVTDDQGPRAAGLAVDLAAQPDFKVDEARGAFGLEAGGTAGAVLPFGLGAAVGQLAGADVGEGALKAKPSGLLDDGADGFRKRFEVHTASLVKGSPVERPETSMDSAMTLIGVALDRCADRAVTL